MSGQEENWQQQMAETSFVLRPQITSAEQFKVIKHQVYIHKSFPLMYNFFNVYVLQRLPNIHKAASSALFTLSLRYALFVNALKLGVESGATARAAGERLPSIWAASGPTTTASSTTG